MNKRWLMPGMGLLLAGALAFGAVQWWTTAAEPPTLSELCASDALARRLSLSATQREALAQLQANYGSNLVVSCDRHCTARLHLRQLLFASEADTNRIRRVVETMGQAQMESELATLTHIREVYRLLTPEQQRVYAQCVNDCLCADCPAHGAQCGRETPTK